MRNHNRKRGVGGQAFRIPWLLLAILFLQAATALWFGFQKQGYFIDEIYSFGLSNGFYKPFITSYDQIFDNWSDESVFHDYMTVQKGERFAVGSVYYNQTQDVHPPLFYEALHIVSSFFPDQYSKWFGIGLNLLFYLACGVLIWLIGRELFPEPWLALLPVGIWGFSAGALSFVMYIRMYLMMTMFTLFTSWVHVRMIRKSQTRKRLAGIFCLSVCGILTQYYFVIFAFFLSAVYCLRKLLTRAWREFGIYAAVMLGAVGAAVAVFPASIRQLTRKDEFVASATRENLGNFSNMKNNLMSYLYSLNTDFFSGEYRAAVCLVLGFLMCAMAGGVLYRRKRRSHGPREDFDGALLMIAWIMTVLTVAVVAVVPSSRYISNLYPLMVITAVWLMRRILQWTGPDLIKPVMAVTAACFVVFSLRSYRAGLVRYLYQEEPARIAAARRYSDQYCLYLTNYRVAALTQDIRPLSCFKGVYVTRAEALEDIDKILEGKDCSGGLIVAVDTNAYWGSGYDAAVLLEDLLKRTDFDRYELLFSQELSETYLVEQVR